MCRLGAEKMTQRHSKRKLLTRKSANLTSVTSPLVAQLNVCPTNHNRSGQTNSWRQDDDATVGCYQLTLQSLSHLKHRQENQHEQQQSHIRLKQVFGCWPPALLSLHSFLLLHLILTLCLLQNCRAAPQSSCILCDNDDRRAKESDNSNYEEFLFEHQVSRQDAISALRVFNETNKSGLAGENFCKSVSCTKQVMKYCLGPQFINDHCWCELGHSEEGLPFVPHICYVGEKIHKASVGSCFFYEEVKECCCAAALAKQWRHISGASIAVPLPKTFALAGIFCVELFRRLYFARQ